MKTALSIAVALFLSLLKVNAQTDSNVIVNSPQGGAEKMLLAGEVSTLWQNNKTVGQPATNTFGAAPLGLMLMPLIKITDRLFLDVQAAVTANPAPGGGANASLNEAIIYY